MVLGACLVLETLYGVGLFVKGKTEEKTGDDVQENLAGDIPRTSPVVLEEPGLHCLVLHPPSDGEALLGTVVERTRRVVALTVLCFQHRRLLRH